MKKNYDQLGFAVFPQLWSKKVIKTALSKVKDQIIKCSQELDCEEADYLCAVSRWAAPSLVTDGLEILISSTIKPQLELFYEASLELVKVNIISKSAYASGPVPFHQDISYSPNSPYEMTTWLPLNDVSLQSGVMEFIPSSHHGPILPAVDFWSPDFKDGVRLSTQSVQVPVKAGDAILFDSKTWHGSAPSTEGIDRYALVTRWKRPHWKPSIKVPDIIKAPFGMWTCHDVTTRTLKNGLELLGEYFPSDNFLSLIEMWVAKLSSASPPFHCHHKKAITALRSLRILHLAAEKHNGGDAHGTIYANVWHQLIRPMESWFVTHCK